MSHRSDQQANSCPAAAAPGQEQENQKPQRISSKMKTRIVQRLMRGESLEPLAREFGTSVAKISQWRDEFLQTGEKAMKKDRGSDEKDRKIAPLEQKLGETTMDFELLQDKVKRLEQKRPLAQRAGVSKPNKMPLNTEGQRLFILTLSWLPTSKIS